MERQTCSEEGLCEDAYREDGHLNDLMHLWASGCQRLPVNTRRAKEWFSPRSNRARSYQYLGLRLQATRTVEWYIYVVWRDPYFGTPYGSPRKQQYSSYTASLITFLKLSQNITNYKISTCNRLSWKKFNANCQLLS